jgi:hypothetical protein
MRKKTNHCTSRNPCIADRLNKLTKTKIGKLPATSMESLQEKASNSPRAKEQHQVHASGFIDAAKIN